MFLKYAVLSSSESSLKVSRVLRSGFSAFYTSGLRVYGFRVLVIPNFESQILERVERHAKHDIFDWVSFRGYGPTDKFGVWGSGCTGRRLRGVGLCALRLRVQRLR